MNLRHFQTNNKFLKSIGLYPIIQRIIGFLDIGKKLIDIKVIKTNKYSSDLYKFSTGNFLIKHFFGYMGHNADPKSGDIGYGFLHYAFIRAFNPERVLCIGSKQGFIPAICALACKDNNHGHVDFVDPGKNEDDIKNWGGAGFWKENNPKEHFSVLGLGKFITTHVMTSKQFANKFRKRKFEYVYIDGDHSYKGVKFDYNTFWKRLAVRGFISFHDITNKGLHHGSEYGVWKLWKEMKDKHKISFIKGDNDNAIGFIQKND